jgi:hypothetical protein
MPPKRVRATSASSSESDEIDRRHNFSADAKALCLTLLEHGGSIDLTPNKLARLPGFPRASTLRQWHTEAQNPPAPARVLVPLGRPPLLADEEVMIMAGFVVFCAEHHQTCGGKEIVAFVEHAFGVTVQKSWVSEKLKPLHITSHRAASLKYTYGGYQSIKVAMEYLEEHQPLLVVVMPRSRVVAVDQIGVWDCGVTTSTYSPEGAYVGPPVHVTLFTPPTQWPAGHLGLRARPEARDVCGGHRGRHLPASCHLSQADGQAEH